MPLCIDHGEQVGVVHTIWRWPWVDQVWHVARCSIDAPLPSWLRQGTRASFGHRNVHEYEVNGWTVISALVDEVSVVGPGFRAVEPQAEVLMLREAKPKPSRSVAAVNSDRAAAADEVVTHGGQVLVRPGIGQVLGIR